MRILSGIQPSGKIHIGNYFGMMRPAIELQQKGETFLFIADYHALTVTPDPELLRQRTFDVAADFLACGLDPSKTVFFRQSDVREVTELAWMLACVTPVGLLERAHSYKDKVSHGIAPNHGLFSYPVLMAADILLYGATLVPVGKDQKQHIEITRDIAMKFNNTYGEILTVPEPMIREDVAVIPGTDGQKMSKTYGNTIEIFGNTREIDKKIMGIVTDSKSLEEPKDPEKCPVFALYRLFSDEAKIEEMRGKYLAGGFGYGHAKKELVAIFNDYFRTIREKRESIAKDPAYVESVLAEGAKKASLLASRTMDKVRKAVGL